MFAGLCLLTISLLAEEALYHSALWHTIRWTRHSINQYHISLWDIKRFVVHCHAVLLWCPLHNTSTFPWQQKLRAKPNKINILPVLWQCAMHQILLCAQRIISQERIISERPQCEGSERDAGLLGNDISHLASQLVGHMSWGTSQISKHDHLGLPGTLSSLRVQTYSNWWRQQTFWVVVGKGQVQPTL